MSRPVTHAPQQFPVFDDAFARHQNRAAGECPLHLRKAAACADEGAETLHLFRVRARTDGLQPGADQLRRARKPNSTAA